MRCVRAPCCQEVDRKKKQTLSNGDMTCSPGRKLKQTINGPWNRRYGSKISSTAPHSLCSLAPLSRVDQGGLTFEDPSSYPEATYFCHPLPQFYCDLCNTETLWLNQMNLAFALNTYRFMLLVRHWGYLKLSKAPNVQNTWTRMSGYFKKQQVCPYHVLLWRRSLPEIGRLTMVIKHF